jgi:hypothetical protein
MNEGQQGEVRPMIDRKLLKRSDKGGRNPQTAAVGSLSGRPGPSEACLMQRTDA